jgi:hypothetical protein
MARLKRQQISPRFFERGEILGLLAGQVGLVDMPVLVAIFILSVKDVFGIVLPHEVADAALAVVGNNAVVRLAQRAHPHIQDALIGGKIGQQGAVSGNLWRATLRIAEKSASRDKGGLSGSE